MLHDKGLFTEALLGGVRRKFLHVDEDSLRPGRRIYFDNAGGSFRLRRALEAFYAMDSLPNCPERLHETAQYMNDVIAQAEEDIRIIFNARCGGRIVSHLTASQMMFALTGAVIENSLNGNRTEWLHRRPGCFLHRLGPACRVV